MWQFWHMAFLHPKDGQGHRDKMLKALRVGVPSPGVVNTQRAALIGQ